jgi:hypothetical protein
VQSSAIANKMSDNKYGAYIAGSTVRDANSTIIPLEEGKYAPVRPWNSQHRNILEQDFEDGSIGAEYRDFDSGFTRLAGKIDKVLNCSQYGPYSPLLAKVHINIKHCVRIVDNEAITRMNYE